MPLQKKVYVEALDGNSPTRITSSSISSQQQCAPGQQQCATGQQRCQPPGLADASSCSGQSTQRAFPTLNLQEVARDSPKSASGDIANRLSSERTRPLSLPGLVAIIYYSVAGGPFGTEDVVSAAGPFLALLGFLIMPFVWSIPEALVSAELATCFPSNGGYVTWVTAAFGPFWGFQEGWLSWLSSASDNAIYPVLFCDYFKHIWAPAGGGYPRIAVVLIFSVSLSWLNYRGLHIVGWSAFILAIFTVLPFAYVVPAGFPEVDVQNMLITPTLGEINWKQYLNVLFWNLNYWDSASTLAGEVHNPRQIFPKALLLTGLLVMASYFLPLAVGVGLPGKGGGRDWRSWHSGSLTLVGEKVGGLLVKGWIVVAAAVSNIGQFVCEQASCSYQLQGMAEWGWLPCCVARRHPHFGTPVVGLGIGLAIILVLTTFEFLSIVNLLNGLYCQAQLLEFAAFLYLRKKYKNLRRPYKVPVESLFSCFALLFAPMVFALVLLLIPVFRGEWLQVSFQVASPALGVVTYKFLELCRKRQWLDFMRDPPQSLEEVLALQTPVSSCQTDVNLSQVEALLEPLMLPPSAVHCA
eukprot:TRINITY_DN41058_c0_g1_i1.p1 TRINITY_DN41058_c0_g1~~TRINITY_DN41058_c0_g1_i1.p1  ORF type:complete len:580 (-),score=59.24 TRINITY_DN41058_c0_g1_i1:238-1977(-)